MFKRCPNRCAPSVLAGRISLDAPSNSAQLATDRKRICAVLKLIHRGRRASPAVPAYRCIHPRHTRHRLPPTANVGWQLRKRQHVELLFSKRHSFLKNLAAARGPLCPAQRSKVNTSTYKIDKMVSVRSPADIVINQCSFHPLTLA